MATLATTDMNPSYFLGCHNKVGFTISEGSIDSKNIPLLISRPQVSEIWTLFSYSTVVLQILVTGLVNFVYKLLALFLFRRK